MYAHFSMPNLVINFEIRFVRDTVKEKYHARIPFQIYSHTSPDFFLFLFQHKLVR